MNARSPITAVAGTVTEAWQELRTHRTRVLLSLIGVALAVCSLTSVIGLGNIMQAATAELNDRNTGRPATLSLTAMDSDYAPVDSALMDSVWANAISRYSISYASRVQHIVVPVHFGNGVESVATTAIDQPYAEMHRLQVNKGAWFQVGQEDNLAPPVVINDAMWERLGKPDLAAHPTVTLGENGGRTGLIIGVVPVSQWAQDPAMFVLVDDVSDMITTDPTGSQDSMAVGSPPNQSNYEAWVPVENWEQISASLHSDTMAQLGEGSTVSVTRQDSGQFGGDPFVVTRVAVTAIAVLILLLGGLGLVNIALVSMRQRIGEIGVRRSFGATSSRIFASVMMESVVGTIAAGGVGITAALILAQAPPVRDFVSQGALTNFPPFPMEAALLGLAVSVAVGAFAGLLPALVAVRVRVIDAIRL